MTAYTEEEAKTKVCCGSCGYFDKDLKISVCRGSACMAWRLSETPDEWNERLELWEGVENIADSHVIERGPEPKPYGYCGLAGASS